MNLLVGVHVSGDTDFGITAAKISLSDDRIKDLLKMAKRAKRPGEILSAYDSTPDLGTTDLDVENTYIRNIDDLTEDEANQVVFAEAIDDGRSELVMLYMDGTDFWWEGVFKHTDIRWETRTIPLSLISRKVKVRARTTTLKSDLNMTPEQMNSIHESIARGISHGLNAGEIVQALGKRVTKTQLVRCLMELIERTHN